MKKEIKKTAVKKETKKEEKKTTKVASKSKTNKKLVALKKKADANPEKAEKIAYIVSIGMCALFVLAISRYDDCKIMGAITLVLMIAGAVLGKTNKKAAYSISITSTILLLITAIIFVINLGLEV